MNLTLQTRTEEFNLWHYRLGHIGNSNFTKVKAGIFGDSNLVAKVKLSDDKCKSCLQGKQL